MKTLIILALLLSAMPSAAQKPTSSANPDSPELTQMYQVDQSEREGPKVDWTALYKHDIERRGLLHKMLADGKVNTGNDYYHAAMIYQHGQNPDDFLLAHVLAVSAIAKGSQGARWLAAATLDRYLRSIWQPQVYGTQFSRESPEPWKHDVMNEDLVSDGMRSSLCVTSLSEQQEALRKAGSAGSPGGTGVKECH